MTQTIKSILYRFPYALPVIAAFLLILTVPPFSLWWLVFVALIPVYLFICGEERLFVIGIGGLCFGALFSGYLSLITLVGFTWLPEAYLFSGLVKALSIPIIVLSSALTACAWLLFALAVRGVQMPLSRVFLFCALALPEALLAAALLGFDYGSISYAGVHVPALRDAAAWGGWFAITVLLFFANAALAEAARGFQAGRAHRIARFVPLALFALLTLGASVWHNVPSSTQASDQLRVAIIQDQRREEGEVFGTVVDGRFSLPSLEEHLEQMHEFGPELIVYPFSPWVGAIAASVDNNRFDRTVITVDLDAFGAWEREHVPAGTTLAVWGTAYRDGVFHNEIQFWEDGTLVSSYQKRELFPFFDYTPQWAQQAGIFSTPYDVTAGATVEPILIHGAAVAGLVCSEVTDAGTAEENARNADLLLAIGSEAMFEGAFIGEFNLLNTQLRAAESGVPAIRANKFGPSAFIDAQGAITNLLPYGEAGILFGSVPLFATDETKTPYSTHREYLLIVLLSGYATYALWRGRGRKN